MGISTPDKACYIINKQHDKINSSIYLNQKIAAFHTTEKDDIVNEKTQSYHDWAIIPLLIGMFIIASVITIYRKYVGQLFERIIYYFTFSKHLQEKSIPIQRLSVILDFLFIISFSMFVDQVVRKFGLYSPPTQFEYIIFLVLSAFLIALRIVRWTIYKLSALFSNQKIFFRELFHNSTLYTRVLGVFLLPMVFLITYTTGYIATLFIYSAILSMVILLIMRLIRLFRVFVVGGFSIFYFILYLCALEIAPLLIIWKEVNSR